MTMKSLTIDSEVQRGPQKYPTPEQDKIPKPKCKP